MYSYENKSTIPETIKTYLETVSQKTINDLELSEINLFLNDLEDWQTENSD
jgi:hypothetical protein